MSNSLPPQLAALLPAEMETTAHPMLIMMSGLPGTGKSYLARRLALELSAVIIESDLVRKVLFPEPSYDAQESEVVHKACRQLMEYLLRQGVRVIYDATNLIEIQRELVYNLAQLIVRTVSPPEVARERVSRRKIQSDGNSDADWSVYLRLAQTEQPIRRSHLCVDTSQDIESVVARLARRVLSHGSGR